MPPIDARIVRAKRFPLHAAVDRCNIAEVKRLLNEDADFHVVRKVVDLDLSVLHSACTVRAIENEFENISYEITKLLIKKGAPINERDSAGQHPLHYAVANFKSSQFIPILLVSECDVNPIRKHDGWTPLHLAAMLGKMEAVQMLLEAGADSNIEDLDENKPEDIALKYRNYKIADILHSPRKKFRPATILKGSETDENYPPEIRDLLNFGSRSGLIDEIATSSLKIKDGFVNWRDPDGNSILHLSAWNGNLFLCRAFFDSIKGRKLISHTNNQGASPLALAIINGQVRVVEEFFMHKQAKKLIDFDQKVLYTGETIIHLLFQYLPTVHPKFILKRKDLTKEHLNATNNLGNSPLLHCAMRRNRESISRILKSKAVKENNLLDFGIQNKEGKSLLHYLVDNKDEDNFRNVLEYGDILTEDIANLKDKSGESCLISCLLRGNPYIARDILEHPSACHKFRLDLCHTSDGRSPLHLVAEQGNASLWQLAVQRPDCDMNSRDKEGNTPLMTAALKGRNKMLESWLNNDKCQDAIKSVNQKLKNNSGKTLFTLIVENSQDPNFIATFLNKIDMTESINEIDNENHSALVTAIMKGKWAIVKEIMSHQKLRKSLEGENCQETISTIDIHQKNKDGLSGLALILLARVKIQRQEQTHLMKKQRVLAEECKKEYASLWNLVKLCLLLEKESHGPSMVQGRDGGSVCIKKQIEPAKLVRPPIPDEIVAEYVKFYQFIKRKKPASQQQQQPVQKEVPSITKSTKQSNHEEVETKNQKSSLMNNSVKIEVNKADESAEIKNQNSNTKISENGKANTRDINNSNEMIHNSMTPSKIEDGTTNSSKSSGEEIKSMTNNLDKSNKSPSPKPHNIDFIESTNNNNNAIINKNDKSGPVPPVRVRKSSGMIQKGDEPKPAMPCSSPPPPENNEKELIEINNNNNDKQVCNGDITTLTESKQPTNEIKISVVNVATQTDSCSCQCRCYNSK